MSDGKMTYEDWLRGCVYHDGRQGYVTLPCDEVLKIADFIERLRADRKTETQYDAEEVAKDINRRVDMSKKEWEVRHYEPHPCKTCPYHEQCNQEDWRTCHWDYVARHYIKPQTERSSE